MDYVNFSRIFTVIASISIIIGLYTQAFKIWRTKSAKDFTWVIIFALLFNELAWLNYGIALFEWPIIIIGLANIPAVIIALIGFIKYRKGNYS